MTKTQIELSDEAFLRAVGATAADRQDRNMDLDIERERNWRLGQELQAAEANAVRMLHARDRWMAAAILLAFGLTVSLLLLWTVWG